VSQSERDWAYAKRALARGESEANVIAAIVSHRRYDKHNPLIELLRLFVNGSTPEWGELAQSAGLPRLRRVLRRGFAFLLMRS
jgi:hypothetical protein